MQFITVLSAASAMVASVSARSAVDLNKSCNKAQPYVRIVNRCPYNVHLWSVFKGDGCPGDQMVTLSKGQTYYENFQDPENGVGVSIKISKTQQCKTDNIVQFEYFLEKAKREYAFNYLDVSYVDCLGNDCPTKHEGYYLKAGSQTGAFAASAGNTFCPILACHDAASCATMSYILPDDVQTKTCDLSQNVDYYLCGGDAPTQDYDSAPAPTLKVEAAAAAVTNAPELKQAAKKIKTEVQTVYVTETAYAYTNSKKRHAHGHRKFHA